MGIRLDWEVEADNSVIRSIGEDPNAARVRRAARVRFLLTVGVALGIVAGIAAFIFWRLDQVNRQIESLLRDTVAAEVASLRLDDWNTFAAVQRSATGDWLEMQRNVFDEYQELLQTNDSVRLTGQIKDIVIDGSRGRVHVEEIIDGTPYTRVWFYWFYEEDQDEDGLVDGWHHVPPDYTFWGERRTYDGDRVNIAYRDVDGQLAAMMGRALDEWLLVACDALPCDTLPEIRVRIAPTDVPQMAWSAEDPWLLEMRSPYVDRARSDRPFSPELQVQAATLISERLIQHVQGGTGAMYPADADFLESAVETWLVGQFVLVDTGSYLIRSLAENYSPEHVGDLLRAIGPDSGVDVLVSVTGESLDEAALDWRDFLAWRLRLEGQLAATRDEANFMRLYDTRDDGIRAAAVGRYNQAPGPEPVVTMVRRGSPAADGSPQIVAEARLGMDEDAPEVLVLFRLVDGVWRRAS